MPTSRLLKTLLNYYSTALYNTGVAEIENGEKIFKTFFKKFKIFLKSTAFSQFDNADGDLSALLRVFYFNAYSDDCGIYIISRP